MNLLAEAAKLMFYVYDVSFSTQFTTSNLHIIKVDNFDDTKQIPLAMVFCQPDVDLDSETEESMCKIPWQYLGTRRRPVNRLQFKSPNAFQPLDTHRDNLSFEEADTDSPEYPHKKLYNKLNPKRYGYLIVQSISEFFDPLIKVPDDSKLLDSTYVKYLKRDYFKLRYIENMPRISVVLLTIYRCGHIVNEHFIGKQYIRNFMRNQTLPWRMVVGFDYKIRGCGIFSAAKRRIQKYVCPLSSEDICFGTFDGLEITNENVDHIIDCRRTLSSHIVEIIKERHLEEHRIEYPFDHDLDCDKHHTFFIDQLINLRETFRVDSKNNPLPKYMNCSNSHSSGDIQLSHCSQDHVTPTYQIEIPPQDATVPVSIQWNMNAKSFMPTSMIQAPPQVKDSENTAIDTSVTLMHVRSVDHYRQEAHRAESFLLKNFNMHGSASVTSIPTNIRVSMPYNSNEILIHIKPFTFDIKSFIPNGPCTKIVTYTRSGRRRVFGVKFRIRVRAPGFGNFLLSDHTFNPCIEGGLEEGTYCGKSFIPFGEDYLNARDPKYEDNFYRLQGTRFKYKRVITKLTQPPSKAKVVEWSSEYQSEEDIYTESE